MDIIDYKINPLWLDSLKEKNHLNDLFSKIGRLLFVCQRFETNCKRVATYIHITTTDDLFSSVDSYSKFLNKVKTSTLNNNIKLVEKLELIGDPIEVLTKARLSRNFIAHEVCIGLENKLNTIADHLTLESDIKSHGEIIANGEFVSTWLCATLLKDPLPKYNSVDKTVNWLTNGDGKTNAV